MQSLAFGIGRSPLHRGDALALAQVENALALALVENAPASKEIEIELYGAHPQRRISTMSIHNGRLSYGYRPLATPKVCQ